jgi:hypothetical protein
MDLVKLKDANGTPIPAGNSTLKSQDSYIQTLDRLDFEISGLVYTNA